MNERHYGVSMLGWPPPPTHSEEIESYSANGGTHQMTSEKKQRIFLFSPENELSAAEKIFFALFVQTMY